MTSEQVRDSWRKVLRDGVIPLWTDEELAAVRAALLHDDPRLMHGGTYEAESRAAGEECISGVCLLAYPLLVSGGITSAEELEDGLAGFCLRVSDRLNDLLAPGHLINAWDEMEPALIRPQVFHLVNAEQARRACRVGA
jgi:hypothetical protein